MSRFPAHICERLFAGSDRQVFWWRLLLISLVGVAAYANTFTNAFNFDDNSNIFGGNALRNMGSLRDLFSLQSTRAVGSISFALNFRLFGSSPVSYHLTNLLIHLAASWLLASLVFVSWKAGMGNGQGDADGRAERQARVAALLAGLLFVAHPIQTQAVTYLVQRYASLSAMFYLAAVLCYARGRMALESGRGWVGCGLWWLGMLVTAFCAVKSKETAYTLPLALVLYEFAFFRGRLRWRLMLLAGCLAVPVLALAARHGGKMFAVVLQFWDSLRMQTAMSRTDYLLSQFPVIAKYLRLIIWPTGQSIEHMAVQYKTFWAMPVAVSCVVLLALLLSGVALLWRGRREGGALRLAGFGIVWFFLTLTVESSIIPIIDLIFEHRVYLPLAGLAMAVAAGIALFAERRPRPGLVYAGAGVLVLVLAVVTHLRNEVWRTPVTLWQDATVKAPQSARAWNNLAYAYLREKRPAEALLPLIRSIELNPGPPDVWNNIGIALEQMGSYEGRFKRNFNMFRRPEDLLKGQTEWFGNAYNNLGLAHEHLRQPAAAIQAYENALKYLPDYPLARFNLGLSALMLGNRTLAIEQFERLQRLDPRYAAELGRLLGS